MASVVENTDELPLVGGHLALDLVNTVEPRFAVPNPREHLDSPTALVGWATRAALVSKTEARRVTDAWRTSPGSGTRALREVIDIREALYTTLLARIGDTRSGGPDPAAELEYLMSRWAGATSRSTLTLNRGGGTGAQLVVGSSPAQLLPDRAVHTAIELLCDVDLTRLHACPPEKGGCGWLFIDRSRNNSRRWCVMSGSCGNQAKARRLTERRRVARASAQHARDR